MCKGIAILVNYDEILMNEVDSHHGNIKDDQDDYLKVELIYDDEAERGYRIEMDEADDYCYELWYNNGFITKNRKIQAKLLKSIKDFCIENEHKFFRIFVKNLQSANIKGDQNNPDANIQYDQNNWDANIKGNQINWHANIGGGQYNQCANIQYGQNNYSANIKGNQDNWRANIEGDILIKYMKVGNNEVTELIKKFSESEQEEYSLTEFLRWLKVI